jgi:hypothetical protein
MKQQGGAAEVETDPRERGDKARGCSKDVRRGEKVGGREEKYSWWVYLDNQSQRKMVCVFVCVCLYVRARACARACACACVCSTGIRRSKKYCEPVAKVKDIEVFMKIRSSCFGSIGTYRPDAIKYAKKISILMQILSWSDLSAGVRSSRKNMIGCCESIKLRLIQRSKSMLWFQFQTLQGLNAGLNHTRSITSWWHTCAAHILY